MDIERFTGDSVSVTLSADEVAEIATALAHHENADDLAQQFDMFSPQMEVVDVSKADEHRVVMEGLHLQRERRLEQKRARVRAIRRFGHLLDLGTVRYK